MKSIFKHLVLFFFALSALQVQAQVTIGSGQAPNKGALLDLKTETDGSSKLGLGLPRVELTNLAPASNADLAKSIGNTTGSYDMTEHIGLIVYNVKDAVFDPATCKTEGGPGLYVWDGAKWQGLGTKGTGTADPLETETATTLTDREGNTYAIATFGTAGTWMTESLRTTTAPGQTAMTESAASSTTDMHYAYPQPNGTYVLLADRPSSTWTAEQGVHYNWQATMNKHTCEITNQGHGEADEQTEIIQGICPFGWHVPSDREWNQLEEVFSASTTQYTNSAATVFAWETSYNTTETWRPSRGIGHGKSMKSTPPLSGIHTGGDSKPATNGGFNLLLAGYAYSGSAYGFGTLGLFWSASSNSANAWLRYFASGTTSVFRGAYARNFLLSVRCKKN